MQTLELVLIECEPAKLILAPGTLPGRRRFISSVTGRLAGSLTEGCRRQARARPSLAEPATTPTATTTTTATTNSHRSADSSFGSQAEANAGSQSRPASGSRAREPAWLTAWLTEWKRRLPSGFRRPAELASQTHRCVISATGSHPKASLAPLAALVFGGHLPPSRRARAKQSQAEPAPSSKLIPSPSPKPSRGLSVTHVNCSLDFPMQPSRGRLF